MESRHIPQYVLIDEYYRAPSLLFENRLCGGASVQVDLVWSGTANRFAIGASLRLDTDAAGYRRDVQATSGYLSSNPPRVHFGLPAGDDNRPAEPRPRRDLHEFRSHGVLLLGFGLGMDPWIGSPAARYLSA